MIVMPNKLNNGTGVVFSREILCLVCATSFDEFAKNANPIETGKQGLLSRSISTCLATIGVAFLSAATSVAALFYFREREVKLWQIWERTKHQNCGAFLKNECRIFVAKLLPQTGGLHKTKKAAHTTYLEITPILLRRKNKQDIRQNKRQRRKT